MSTFVVVINVIMIYVPVEVNTGAVCDDDGVVHDDDGNYGDGDDNDDDYDDADDNDMFLLAGLERSTLELLKEDEEEPKCLHIIIIISIIIIIIIIISIIQCDHGVHDNNQLSVCV